MKNQTANVEKLNDKATTWLGTAEQITNVIDIHKKDIRVENIK